MTLPRVVYLSNPPLHGGKMLDYLRTLPCEVVYANIFDAKLAWLNYVGEGYDLGLNFLATHKVPADEVARPRLGWVNFHPGPLPQYRGRNLCYHAIMNGESEFGATVHYMDASYDTGPVIEVFRFPVLNYTAGELHDAAIRACKYLFAKWAPQLLGGRVPATPQDPAGGAYYRKAVIPNDVALTATQRQHIRALTYPPKHYARVAVGGRWYKIVPEEEEEG